MSVVCKESWKVSSFSKKLSNTVLLRVLPTCAMCNSGGGGGSTAVSENGCVHRDCCFSSSCSLLCCASYLQVSASHPAGKGTRWAHNGLALSKVSTARQWFGNCNVLLPLDACRVTMETPLCAWTSSGDLS